MHSVVLKNDAVGDFTHSIQAIENIINSKKNDKITIFLSKLTKNFSFLVEKPKVKIKILNFNLNIFEKIYLLIFFFTNKIDKVYILTPKNFYFYLPFFFRKIKFYAVCVNNINNYMRPSIFLRKYLFKIELNERNKKFKREHISVLLNKLTSDDCYEPNSNFSYTINKTNNDLIDHLPKNFIYFHFKKERFDWLKWSFNDLLKLFNEFDKFNYNIVFTKDIIKDNNNILFKENFNSFDCLANSFNSKKNNTFFIDNAEGKDLLNIIYLSKKVYAFHGMMTNLGYLLKKPVLDLFSFKILNIDHYHKMRNSFYEFKPVNKNYKFIIPSSDINKTIKKSKFFLK